LRIGSCSKNEQDFLKGCGAIEACIATIIRLLEDSDIVELVHPNTCSFNYPSDTPFARCYFLGIELKKNRIFENNIIIAIRKKLLDKRVKEPEVSFIFRNKLPAWVFEDYNDPKLSPVKDQNEISTPEKPIQEEQNHIHQILSSNKKEETELQIQTPLNTSENTVYGSPESSNTVDESSDYPSSVDLPMEQCEPDNGTIVKKIFKRKDPFETSIPSERPYKTPRTESYPPMR